jgi:hypothetical protein
MKCLILISGWKGSGKDAFAKKLISYGFTRIAFADALKDQVAKRYAINRRDLDDPVLKERPLYNYPVHEVLDTSDMAPHYQKLTLDRSHRDYLFHTPRSLLILDGSLARKIDPNIWANHVVSKIMKSRVPNIVIPDFRYKNELSQLKKSLSDYRIITVRISRYSTTNAVDDSERALDRFPFDIHINNSGSLELFEAKIEAFIHQYNLGDSENDYLVTCIILSMMVALAIPIIVFLIL